MQHRFPSQPKMKAYEIRKTTEKDLPSLLALYEKARVMMRESGNPTQWITYPEESLLRSDIENGIGYAVVSEGAIIATFVFFAGAEKDYAEIDGAWLNDEPYGVIHRIASDGVHGGAVTAATEYASRVVNNIRIDTHPDNKVMQHVLEKNGYVRCGNITIVDDWSNASPRIAYQKICK